MFYKYKNYGIPMPINEGLIFNNLPSPDSSHLNIVSEVERPCSCLVMKSKQSKLDVSLAFLAIQYHIDFKEIRMYLDPDLGDLYLWSQSAELQQIVLWIEERMPYSFTFEINTKNNKHE